MRSVALLSRTSAIRRKAGMYSASSASSGGKAARKASVSLWGLSVSIAPLLGSRGHYTHSRARDQPPPRAHLQEQSGPPILEAPAAGAPREEEEGAHGD